MTGAVDFGSWFAPCGAHVGLLGASWATFFRFWAHLCLQWRFEAIFFDFGSILGGFWLDLGWILGGFFEDFWDFLRKRRSSKFVRPRSVS